MGRLEGKVALVTGGNSGIGLATAKRFVSEGAHVFITGRRDTELAAAVKEIGKNVTGVQGDVSNLGDLDRLFARLGIAEALAPKTVKPDTESVSERVAAGEVELGLIVIPNILSVPGAELVGPIPAEVQSYIVFTAAVSAQSPHQQTARDLIKRLTSPDTVPFIKAKGMEPG